MPIFKTSKARESILSKIRNGLAAEKLPMPFPEAEQQDISNVFDYGDMTPEEAFANAFSQLGGKFVFCEHMQEFIDNLHVLYDSRGWKEVLCTEPVLLQLLHNNKLDFVHAADISNSTADACITRCEALIGRTGSIILSSRQPLGRVAPVYYPVHIVVAYPNQIVKDMQQGLDFMKQKYGDDMPSMINFNTGASRTADIEKTLVVGVHGPAEVFCFYINS